MTVNYEVFTSSLIRESMKEISKVSRDTGFDIKRWNNVLIQTANSGTVLLPIVLGGRLFREPLYWVCEKIGPKELLRVKPVKGEQWGIGDCYGFFGLSEFDKYEYGKPIILVEGISDWAVIRLFYPWVLCTLGAHVTLRQAWFLRGLTEDVSIGFDPDEAGVKNSRSAKLTLATYGIRSSELNCPISDWGEYMECGDWEQSLVDRVIESWLNKNGM
jgi:hypothetical protein